MPSDHPSRKRRHPSRGNTLVRGARRRPRSRKDQAISGLKIATKGAFGLCVANEGADDLELCKVYRLLPDKAGATSGYVRVVDESGEDYLYPQSYFVLLPLPPKARRVVSMAARSSDATKPRRRR